MQPIRRLPIASLLAVPFLGLALRAQSPFTEPEKLPADRAAGAAAVDVARCKEWLGTLASPEFEGRHTGEPGFQKAADFVSAHFKALGLEARGENGTYLQTVPWTAAKIDEAKTYVAFRKDDKEVLRVPAEHLSGSVSSAISAKGDVVLLVVEPPPRPSADDQGGGRRGFRVPEIPGIADLDVAGKVVLAYIQPVAGDNREVMTRFGLMMQLASKNPAALLFVQDKEPSGKLTGRSGSSRTANPAAAGRRRQPGEVTFGGKDLELMLAAGGVDPKALAAKTLAPAIQLQAEVEIAVGEGQAPAWNVWGVIPGSDPKLKDEYVVIGSHLDHIGMRGGLHPGADDDGSGTTGVMAVSTMFTKNAVKPKRSILFVCFCGEEDGLVGSGYFARNPPIPLSAIAAELQMDMIGRDEEESPEGNQGEKAEDNRTSLHLVGTQKLSPQLHEICLAKNDAAGFAIEYDEEGMFGRSDHANFARMGVPIAFFFTGLHHDYHQTSDTPDKIHYEKLLRVATYVYDIAFELAQQEGRPEVDPQLWAKFPRKGSEQPAAPLLKQ